MSPYDASEQRIAKFFFEAGAGGGDDPVGALIAAHQFAMSEIARLRAALEAVEANAECMIARTLAGGALGRP